MNVKEEIIAGFLTEKRTPGVYRKIIPLRVTDNSLSLTDIVYDIDVLVDKYGRSDVVSLEYNYVEPTEEEVSGHYESVTLVLTVG